MKEYEIMKYIADGEMPDIEQIRHNCVNQTLPDGRRHTRKIAIAVAVALAAIMGAVAFAAAGGVTLFFDKVPERADSITEYDYYEQLKELKNNPGVILNEDVFLEPNYMASEYTINFSNYDEINDLFSVQFGNKYMDAVQMAQYSSITNGDGIAERYIYGEPQKARLYISAKDGVPEHAQISSTFIVNDINFHVYILIPLEPGFDATGVFSDGFVDVNDSDTEEYFYTNKSNGINARILLNQKSPSNWNMTILFSFNGACYQITGQSVELPDVIRDPHQTAEMFIDAFE